VHCGSLCADLVLDGCRSFFLTVLSASQRLFVILVCGINHIRGFDIQRIEELRAVEHLFGHGAIFKVVAGLALGVIVTGVFFAFDFGGAEGGAIGRGGLFGEEVVRGVFVGGVVLAGGDDLGVKFLYFFRESGEGFGEGFAAGVVGVG
jgi:hypothetical protein